MRASAFHINTIKEAPNDAEIASHRLMMRAGMIRKLAGGIYSYMPLGLRVIRKIEKIIREEMNAAGALERAKGWAVLKDLVGEIANLPVPVGGPIQVPVTPPATVVVDLSGLEAQLAANTAAVDGLGELVGQWTEALAALAEVLRGAAQSNKALVAALSKERPARKLVVRENEDGTVTVES